MDVSFVLIGLDHFFVGLRTALVFSQCSAGGADD